MQNNPSYIFDGVVNTSLDFFGLQEQKIDNFSFFVNIRETIKKKWFQQLGFKRSVNLTQICIHSKFKHRSKTDNCDKYGHYSRLICIKYINIKYINRREL